MSIYYSLAEAILSDLSMTFSSLHCHTMTKMPWTKQKVQQYIFLSYINNSVTVMEINLDCSLIFCKWAFKKKTKYTKLHFPCQYIYIFFYYFHFSLPHLAYFPFTENIWIYGLICCWRLFHKCPASLNSHSYSVGLSFHSVVSQTNRSVYNSNIISHIANINILFYGFCLLSYQCEFCKKHHQTAYISDRTI